MILEVLTIWFKHERTEPNQQIRKFNLVLKLISLFFIGILQSVRADKPNQNKNLFY